MSGSPLCPECGQPSQVVYNRADGSWARCAAGHQWRVGGVEGRILGIRELMLAFVVAVLLGVIACVAGACP